MLSPKEWRRLRSGAVGLLLYILPLPLLLKAVISLWTGDGAMLAVAGGGWALFLLAATVCRRGLQTELLLEERPFLARRARLLKYAGGGILALATAMTAIFGVGHSVPIALAFAALAVLGYVLLYGGDPASEPHATPEARAFAAEAEPLLREAYTRLERLEAASRQIAGGDFRKRLDSIVVGVERILKLLSDDPRDLPRARKFITVYLDGAQRITEEYARRYGYAGGGALDETFHSLLVDMENTCEQQYQKLLQHDASDLEVQIEVLSTRLRREGVV